MSVRQALQIESDVATDRPVTIPFEFNRTDKFPEGKKPGDRIVITPMTVRTWFRIKPYLMQFEKEDLERIASISDAGFTKDKADLMSRYDETVFEIICIGMYNKAGDMPQWFREVLKDNCTWEDLYIILNAILYRIGFNPFSRTITALEAVSPLSEDELIALQRNNETWPKKDRKATSCSS